MKTIYLIAGLALAFLTGYFVNSVVTDKAGSKPILQNKAITNDQQDMNLGAFSVSLNVQDLHASQTFYENLDFHVFAGSLEQNYLIMKNGNALIGLFQGMLEGNLLTFNPGWDENAQNIADFTDVREIQKRLKSKGVLINPEADETTSGPASFLVADPDGNVLLFDQHR